MEVTACLHTSYTQQSDDANEAHYLIVTCLLSHNILKVWLSRLQRLGTH